MIKQILTICVGLVLTILSTGCATWTNNTNKNKSAWSSMQFWKKEYQRPAQMAVIWSPDILVTAGKAPTRGFGGRIYFYNEKTQAIPVDGELKVHGYLEQKIGRVVKPGSVEADKTFAFAAEQLTSHYTPSDLGASYSIWVPWDSADGVQQQITLIATFKDKNGAVVQGEAAKVVLPGRTPEEPQGPASPFQQVSFSKAQIPTNNNAIEVSKDSSDGLRTTTITVPAKTSRNLAKSSNSVPSGVQVGGGANTLLAAAVNAQVQTGQNSFQLTNPQDNSHAALTQQAQALIQSRLNPQQQAQLQSTLTNYSNAIQRQTSLPSTSPALGGNPGTVLQTGNSGAGNAGVSNAQSMQVNLQNVQPPTGPTGLPQNQSGLPQLPGGGFPQNQGGGLPQTPIQGLQMGYPNVPASFQAILPPGTLDPMTNAPAFPISPGQAAVQTTGYSVPPTR